MWSWKSLGEWDWDFGQLAPLRPAWQFALGPFHGEVPMQRVQYEGQKSQTEIQAQLQLGLQKLLAMVNEAYKVVYERISEVLDEVPGVTGQACGYAVGAVQASFILKAFLVQELLKLTTQNGRAELWHGRQNGMADSGSPSALHLPFNPNHSHLMMVSRHLCMAVKTLTTMTRL